MAAVREKWTDERLDDLSDRVTDGFRRVDERFVHLERVMAHGFIALVTLQATSLAAILGFIAVRT